MESPTAEQVYKLILAKLDHIVQGDFDALAMMRERHRIEIGRQDAMLSDLERNLAESKDRIAALEQENHRLSHQVSIGEVHQSPASPEDDRFRQQLMATVDQLQAQAGALSAELRESQDRVRFLEQRTMAHAPSSEAPLPNSLHYEPQMN